MLLVCCICICFNVCMLDYKLYYVRVELQLRRVALRRSEQLSRTHFGRRAHAVRLQCARSRAHRGSHGALTANTCVHLRLRPRGTSLGLRERAIPRCHRPLHLRHRCPPTVRSTRDPFGASSGIISMISQPLLFSLLVNCFLFVSTRRFFCSYLREFILNSLVYVYCTHLMYSALYTLYSTVKNVFLIYSSCRCWDC